ncbi:sensor histidine kinase [Halorubrum sp. 48-1-W]|uniref:sensor histidine kinase n=1 Tax=Halorubrum sp. 48-1-W TaxID=2249761 RepID=UPI000DCBBEFF|nr:ATP-binding protein [Halorubrum sp. 48-1-W]RAW45427.1 sensor histidine kinase [Halorubrum sp. 48-1-W]
MDTSRSPGRTPVPFERDAPIPIAFSVSGGLLLLVGVLLAAVALRDGESVLVALLDIVFFWIPGVSFVYAGYWLSRSDLPNRSHPRIVAWTGGGVVVMYGFIALRDLHPGVTVEWSIGTQAIGLALGAVIGLVMGIQRSRATIRTATLEDRTRELEANERELERRNDQLERFASVVSHDLRNPLSVARGNLELVRDDRDSDRLTAIADAHARMETLIDDLLTLARQGETIDSTESIDLTEVSRVCWELVSTGDATLSIEDVPPIVADRDRLRQLLENLFRNAVEHGGPHVTIRVGPLDDAGGFYVADDGPGIPGDERDRVFESGYSTAESGTGFGLAIVAGIAAAHGWDVRAVESATGGARIEVTGVEFA